MNSITVVGNLSQEPELKFVPSGAAVATFSVAVNKRVNKDGAWEDVLMGFFNCTAWRDLAENVAELSKGDRVIVTGTLQQRSWEDDSGKKRYVVEIQAEDVGRSLKFKEREGF